MTFTALDNRLINPHPRVGLEGVRRFVLEFFYFGIKNARASLFAGLFFAAMFLVPRAGVLGLPRYDVLLLVALALLAWMVLVKLETLDELKVMCGFYVLGFVLEVFKTSSSIQSWSYPDFAYTKLFGVPLFAGFTYAAVGSYMMQVWRLFHLCTLHHPPYWMACTMAILVYVNFFTHPYIGDYRLYIAACAAGLYTRATVLFRPLDRDRKMPILLCFALIVFFIWLTDDISKFFSLWHYFNQLGAWSAVHADHWSSWSLLMVMTFTIIAKLKHMESRFLAPD